MRAGYTRIVSKQNHALVLQLVQETIVYRSGKLHYGVDKASFFYGAKVFSNRDGTLIVGPI